MTIAGISSNVSIFAARNTPHEKSAVAEMISSAGLPESDFANSPAAIVDISEPAKQMAEALPEAGNEDDVDDAVKIANILHGPEVLKAWEDRLIEVTTRPTDPFVYEDLMRSMKYDFRPCTSEYTIDAVLKDHSINSSVVANELSTMLRQTFTGKDLSVEQRAENRESALKCAQFIAANFLSPNEETVYMSAINKLYTEDILSDKGYFENTFHPGLWLRHGETVFGDKIAPPDYMTIGFDRAYCEALGVDDLKWMTREDWDEYRAEWKNFMLNASPEEKAEMEAKGLKIVMDKEMSVIKATQKAKNNFNYELYKNNLKRLLKAFEW